MRKLLIPVALIASFLLTACSSDPIVNRLPFVYRIDIQQGNVLSQEAVNQLRTGMNKRQVQFVLGSPLLIDPFHANRWDYVYLFEPGSDSDKKPSRQRVTLFFDDEQRVSRITGTMLPQPSTEAKPRNKQVTVEVPPQEPEDIGILTRFWRWLGFGEHHEQ
ncbi:MAG TPA: outer membrane protein assembly factor BamE [Gammaproteobacteria bacterium]|nr:outer membrane protein assembly factor BamE [Gammaproteobacteria bacterium]